MIPALVVLAVGTLVMKGVGPFLLAGRELPAWLDRYANAAAVTLLAALLVTQAAATDTTVVIDARVVGVAVAGLLLWLRAPVLLVIFGAAGVTALVRALGWG